eukprot:CAMPEP_0115055184 /NCGR_PEP_ID=MMETSP0227-20121206/4513_1 /TAXON_ID=89957 /ORGANISM="Polarella glacialis, Strain CCMP 1383" /LENGTH=612 /DNA_ID=CAMNT_0002439751 /DNA_START=45 /DNA_END=1879 /DNA_ORIENTATION=+
MAAKSGYPHTANGANGTTHGTIKGSDMLAAVTTAAQKAADLKVNDLGWRTQLEFFVNGKLTRVDDAQPHHTLLWFLRDRLCLTGTKLGCGEGGCGACTVTVSHFDGGTQEVVHRSVNACLAPLCSVDGCAVTTVEGIGSSREPHPVQQRIAELHGSQCGYCTPGIVMSLYTALCRKPEPTLADLEESFDGNLCRCTGYRPILDAAKTFACDKHNCPPAPEGFKGPSEKPEAEGDARVFASTSATLASMASCPVPPVAFPEALRASAPHAPLQVVGSRVTWYRPADLASLLALKKAEPKAKMVAGNTEVGIETKFKHFEFPVMISTTAVKELSEVAFDDGNGDLVIGGAVNLSSLEHFLEKTLESRPKNTSQGLKAMLDMIRWFASTQIRNVAVLAGNIATASPISDMNPVLLALGASVLLASAGAPPREVPVRDFFKSYRVVDMLPSEVIAAVKVPSPPPGAFEFVKSFKQAKRRDDDISIVNACIRILLKPSSSGWTVEKVSTGFGGMAPTTVRASRMEAVLEGAAFCEASFERARAALAEDLALPESVPGGMAAYRQTLTASFLFKFYVGVCLDLATLTSVCLDLAALTSQQAGLPPAPPVSPSDALACR